MRIVQALLVATIAGCNFSGPRMCALSISPAVVVEVRDARTGSFIAADAHGAVREGSYVDSLRPYTFGSSDPASLQSLQAALGRTGTYSIEIEHPGYQRWTISGIRVTKESCGVRTARLRASLIPTS
jgi:hypothetical protein